MNTGTRLGISGDINKLASIAHSVTHTKNHNFSTIRHFSLGLRPWEKLDCSLIDFLTANDITLSAHPTDINFSETVNIPDLKSLKKALTSWPVLYIEEDMGLWRSDQLFLGAHQLNPVMNEASLLQTKKNLIQTADILELPIVVENPPVYYEGGNIDFWNYYLTLCTESKSQMAFDIGHYMGYCKSQGERNTYTLPDHELWKHVKTLHLSGIKSWQWNGLPVWLDQHADEFKQTSLELLKLATQRASQFENILLEMEGATPLVEANNLNTVTSLLKGSLHHD